VRAYSQRAARIKQNKQQEETTMWGFFALSVIALLASVLALLRRYAAPSVQTVVKVATAYAWLVAFIVVALVPMDVYMTLTQRSGGGGSGIDGSSGSSGGGADVPLPPGSMIPGADGGSGIDGNSTSSSGINGTTSSGGGTNGTETTTGSYTDSATYRSVDVMWKVCYWSTQILTWLLLPFFQVYADAGDFTPGARCATSLKENGLLYGAAAAAGAVGIVGVLVAERTLRLADLAALGMGLSNTFALSVGLLLMGYGLVEIPREAWKSRPEQRLKWCAHRAGRLAGEVLRATAELEAVVRIVVANERQMPRRDPLRPYMELIAAAAEKDSPVKPSQVGVGLVVVREEGV
jgi:hypothetical protein